MKGGAVSPSRERHPRPNGPPSPLTHGRADPCPPRQRHLKRLVRARTVQHRSRLADWATRGGRSRLRAGLGARATEPGPWANGPRAERAPRDAPVCARSPEAAPTAPPAPQRPMRRRPERRGGLAGPATRGRGPAGGCAASRSPGRWRGRRRQGYGTGCGLREGMGAPGRLWASGSRLPYLPACHLCCAAVGPPTLSFSSFFSFASSPMGSAWVLCAEQEFPSWDLKL